MLTSENQTYSTSSQISKTLKVNFQKPEGEPAGDEVASDLLVAASPPSPPPPPPVLESPDQIFGVKINYELASSENQSPKPVECLESKIRQCESWKNEKVSFLRNVGLQPQQRDKCLFLEIKSFNIFEYSLYALFAMGSHVLPHIARFNKSFLANLTNLTL